MKAKILAVLAMSLVLVQWALSGSSPHRPAKAGAEAVLKDWYLRQTGLLLQELDLLAEGASRSLPLRTLQDRFAACRFRYKRSEAMTEYYFGGLCGRINGPALPDVRI